MAVVTILLPFLSKLIGDEISAWLPKIRERLLKHAVLRLPEELHERFKEEWAADLLSYPGEISKCIRALGFCWASERMRNLGHCKFFKVMLMLIWRKIFLLYAGKYFNKTPDGRIGTATCLLELLKRGKIERDQQLVQGTLTEENAKSFRVSIRREELREMEDVVFRVGIMIRVAKLFGLTN